MTPYSRKVLSFAIAISTKLWQGLTEPFESLPEVGDHRRSVMTTAFLFFAIIAVSTEQSLAGNTPFNALVLLSGGYFLARTRWYRYAAIILILSLSFPSYLVVLRLQNPDSQRVMAAFAWLILPLLLSSLIYPVRITFVLGAINFLAISLLPRILPELNYSVIGGTLGFYGFTAAIMLIVTTQRNQIENDRQKELIANRENLSRQVREKERFVRQSQRQADQLAMLYKISNAISNLQNLESILQLIFEKVKSNIHLDVFFIALYDEKSNIISFPLMYDGGVFWQEPEKHLQETTSISRVIATGQSFLLNRSATEIEAARVSTNRVGDPTHVAASIIVIPLQAGGNIIGAISVQSYESNAYHEDHRELLAALAQQVTVAIENARLFDAANERAQRLMILNEISRAVAELKDMPDLLQIVYDLCKKSFSLDAFFVGLYLPETHEIAFPIIYDDGRRYQRNPEPISEGSFLDLILKGERDLLINRSPAEIASHLKSGLRLGDDTKPSASIVATALKLQERVIGLISAQSYTRNAFDEADLQLLNAIANQVSIAIENSRLYTAAQLEIAERQKMEDQLRTAEAKYRELVERSPAVIYNSETGAAGRWFYVSPQIENLLGFTAQEWIADPNLWYQQIHPEDREYAITAEAQALAENRNLGTEYRMYTKDGRLIWIHDESLNVSISDKQQYVVQGILTNITFRKQAEFDLRESEEKYHSLFNTAERQARELTLLGEVQSALARELELSVLLKTVVDAVAKTFGYTFVSLYVLEDDSLQLQHQVGYEEAHVIESISANEGVSGQVIRTGLPVLIKDVAKVPNFLRASSLIKSEICVPLFDNNRIFGTLNVESSPEYQLTEDDLRLLNNLSDQINIAIRRARLYTERAESLRREQLINDFARAINSTHELADILELVARLSAEMVDADGASVSMMSDDGLAMTGVYSYPEDPGLDRVMQQDKGITWWTYQKGRPIILDEYSQQPDATEILTASALYAYMGVPISIGEKRLGAIALYNRTSQRKFTLRDLSLIETVAQEIAVAIQNARLIEELQRERDFAVQIMNLLGQGISVATLDNKFEYVNPALAKILGYDPGEMIGTDIEKYLMPGEMQRFLKEYENQASNGATSLEIVIKHKNGNPIHVLVTSVPRYSGTTATGSITSITDLSERKQIELEREMLLKDMEAKNAELERFTYTVSHDLKSPLVTIAGFLGFLEADIKKGDLQKIEGTIRRIRDAAKKMQRLLNELLELSRIGRLANPSEDVPFGELVSEALELAEGQLAARQVQVQVEAGLPAMRVDRVRIIEVIQNLVVNSSKFMGDQEHPRIEIGMKTIRDQKTFFVRDNGVGIAPKFHERIFGLFNKLDPFSDGTGIGLALVKRIIEVHGGKIWVESELGRGATFFFTLAENK